MYTNVVAKLPEWRYQAAVICRLHKLESEGLPIACAGDMNRGHRSRAAQSEAIATGMTAGEADVRVYVARGRLLQFELKTPRGSRSKAQRARHARLADLGFEVLTISAATPDSMADEVEKIVRAISSTSTDAPGAR